jgi:hypothetical protein
MEPTTPEIAHEQRMRQRQDHLAQYRTPVDEHVQLARPLRDLHERYLALKSDPAMSIEEGQAETAQIVSAQGEVLRRAQHVLGALQQFLREQH